MRGGRLLPVKMAGEPLRRSICYVASYDPGYPRNTDIIRVLKRAGVRIERVAARATTLDRTSSRLDRKIIRPLFEEAIRRFLLPLDVGLRMLRCDALAVGYAGQIDMLVVGPVARALNKPVIFNPLVTLTDTIIEDRKLVRGGLPVSVIRWIDRASLKLADLVLVDTEENAAFVCDQFCIERSRILVFPVGVDERIFFPSKGSDDPARAGLDVLYYGKFIPLHGVETIVHAAALLEQARPDIRFEMIGHGQEYKKAREIAGRSGPGGIKWTDWLPYSALGDRLRRTDVALGVFSSGTKAARVIPNKVHQALACAVPVVTRESPAVERLLKHRHSALLVPPGDGPALASALIQLADDPALRRKLGSNGRDAWQGYASEERLMALMGEVLGQVAIGC